MIIIIILFAAMGMLIGVVSGFFGVGGGFILTPILLLLGTEPIPAITISLLYTIGTSLSGAFAHFKMKNVKWKEASIIALSGMAATQAANPLVYSLNNNGYDETVIPFALILILSYFAWSLLVFKKKNTLNTRKPVKKWAFVFLVIIGVFGGFLSALLGVGGGFIIVPLLISIGGFYPKHAIGTSLLSVLFIVSTGFITYFIKSPIDLSAGAILLAGGLAGAQAGAFLTGKYKHAEMRFMLGMLYLFTALSMVLKLFGLDVIGMAILCLFLGFLYIKMLLKWIGKRKKTRSF
ncbi:sulfite exporter TauE/SafE family protein [Metabacillus idriensis]|uniref:sulfite exporter TauE/SafE family protein n=1 Tax=Metabacillus idriensis TaxID=324768 RepID=UPI00174C00A2|nr:sulfite exporter TauE/SafE family protein [Metabacillus idriensis]